MRFISLFCMAVSLNAMGYEVSSPDGLTAVEVNETGGRAYYSVSYAGQPFVLPSPLGLTTDLGDWMSGVVLESCSPVEQVERSYSLPNIKRSQVDYRANCCEFTFTSDGKPAFTVQFEISDNNVAFRYRLPAVGDTRCCVVKGEATGFTFPEGTTTFLCPQATPMTGFARTAPSYETHYTVDDTMGKNGWGEGYTFPCLFRNGDNGWVLVSETGIAGDYCGSRLLGHDNGLYTVGYPMPGEMNGMGSSMGAIELPGSTPWRTITVGRTLAPIAETTVTWDVVEPLYEASRDYEYGKGTWSWIIRMDDSCNYDEQKEYIDFAASMGYRSVLVDALWDTKIGREGIERLAAYGKERGVGLYLWYNSNGWWNDAPQGPRGIMSDNRLRRADMAWMQRHGVLGIKVDFFGGDKQEMMKLYHDILTDANDYGLLVVFHGCTLPRGWERMYPNYASSEAVRASENLHFSQSDCDAEAFCATIHPFVRNAVGSMDFGGSALNKYYSRDNNHGSRRVTSDVYALATAVLFQSPVQHFALAPNNLDDAPVWAIDFMKQVPVTWDETRFIDGYPGRYAVIARRHGDTWYIAGINAADKPVRLLIELPEKEGTSVLYTDNQSLEGSMVECKADRKGHVKVSIPRNGGMVIVNNK